jgi:hypothetical protein
MSGFGIKKTQSANVTPSNLVNFDQDTPTTGGVVFTPNDPATVDTLYVSSTNASTWIWDGASYITYTAPSTASTEWFLTGTTIDAGANKTANITRSGGVYLNGSHDSNWMLNILNSGTTNAHGLAMFIGASSTGIPFRAGKGTSNYFSVNNDGKIALLNYTLPVVAGTAGQVLADTLGDGTLDWTTVSSATINGAILYVSPQGSDVDATRAGHIGNMLLPFLTLEVARDASLSGDTIHVFPGTYTVTTTDANGLSIDGVSWYFEKGSIVNKATSGRMWSGTAFALPMYILGYGEFYGSASCSYTLGSISSDSIIEALYLSSTSNSCVFSLGSRVKITCPTIISTAGWAIYGGGGNYLYITCELIRSTATYALDRIGSYSVITSNEITVSGASCMYLANSNNYWTINANSVVGLISVSQIGTLNIRQASSMTLNAVGTSIVEFNGQCGTIICGGVLRGNIRCSVFTSNSTASHATGLLMYGNDSNLTVTLGYVEVDYDILSNTNRAGKFTISGGYTLMRGYWEEVTVLVYSTITAGRLRIADDMFIKCAQRNQFLTMSGTAIVDLGASRIIMNNGTVIGGLDVANNTAIRYNGGTLISNGATITTANTEIPPIIANVAMDFKVLSGGFNTNRTENGGSLAAKKKKQKFTVTSVLSTSITLNDGSGGNEVFTEADTGTYSTQALLAQQMAALINASGTLDLTATQDTPGTDTYFYVESDVAGITFTRVSVTNLAYLMVRDNSFLITNVTGGSIIEDAEVE